MVPYIFMLLGLVVALWGKFQWVNSHAAEIFSIKLCPWDVCWQ